MSSKKQSRGLVARFTGAVGDFFAALAGRAEARTSEEKISALAAGKIDLGAFGDKLLDRDIEATLVEAAKNPAVSVEKMAALIKFYEARARAAVNMTELVLSYAAGRPVGRPAAASKVVNVNNFNNGRRSPRKQQELESEEAPRTVVVNYVRGVFDEDKLDMSVLENFEDLKTSIKDAVESSSGGNVDVLGISFGDAELSDSEMSVARSYLESLARKLWGGAESMLVKVNDETVLCVNFSGKEMPPREVVKQAMEKASQKIAEYTKKMLKRVNLWKDGMTASQMWRARKEWALSNPEALNMELPEGISDQIREILGGIKDGKGATTLAVNRATGEVSVLSTGKVGSELASLVANVLSTRKDGRGGAGEQDRPEGRPMVLTPRQARGAEELKGRSAQYDPDAGLISGAPNDGKEESAVTAR